MKYTSPIYKNETIETKDVICESIFTISNRTETVTVNGVETTKDITQISVDIGKLFWFELEKVAINAYLARWQLKIIF